MLAYPREGCAVCGAGGAESCPHTAPHCKPPAVQIRAGESGALSEEDIVPNRPSVLVFSRKGYIKRMPADLFATQVSWHPLPRSTCPHAAPGAPQAETHPAHDMPAEPACQPAWSAAPDSIYVARMLQHGLHALATTAQCGRYHSCCFSKDEFRKQAIHVRSACPESMTACA